MQDKDVKVGLEDTCADIACQTTDMKETMGVAAHMNVEGADAPGRILASD